MRKIFLCCMVMIFFLSGCNNTNSTISIKKNNEVSYVQAKELIINKGAIVIDVRTKEEYDGGHIEGAVLLPVDDITEDSIKDIVKNKDDVMIVYCKSGVRSKKAAQLLKTLGYNNVFNLGSIDNWKE